MKNISKNSELKKYVCVVIKPGQTKNLLSVFFLVLHKTFIFFFKIKIVVKLKHIKSTQYQVMLKKLN